MLKFKQTRVIEVSDWDNLVRKLYDVPYSFQQQDGCKPRGTHHITIPDAAYDYKNDSIPEEINGDKMGVSFQAWLSRDPSAWNGDASDNNRWCIDLFWERNFYPDVQMIANDLYNKGLVEAGDYVINIDW